MRYLAVGRVDDPEVGVVPPVCELLEALEVRGHGVPEFFLRKAGGGGEVVPHSGHLELRVRLENHGRHDAEGAASAAADRPEEVWVVRTVGCDESARCGNERDGEDVVG